MAEIDGEKHRAKACALRMELGESVIGKPELLQRSLEGSGLRMGGVRGV